MSFCLQGLAALMVLGLHNHQNFVLGPGVFQVKEFLLAPDTEPLPSPLTVQINTSSPDWVPPSGDCPKRTLSLSPDNSLLLSLPPPGSVISPWWQDPGELPEISFLCFGIASLTLSMLVQPCAVSVCHYKCHGTCIADLIQRKQFDMKVMC